jgi:hypothetical protein
VTVQLAGQGGCDRRAATAIGNAEARRHGAASLARWLERHAAGSLEEMR